MVRDLRNTIDHEEQVLKNLEEDINNYPNSVQRNKRFGRTLPKSIDHLKKNVYLYFCQLARRKQLSRPTLTWMANFAQTSPYFDIKNSFKHEGWIKQFRELPEEK